MGQIKHNAKLTSRAQALRRNATPQEKRLWYDFLSGYPIRFRRQVTMDIFIVDFYCHKAKLVIELDGGQHYTVERMGYDAGRTELLERNGLKVLRISNDKIDSNFRQVCEYIDTVVHERIASDDTMVE